MRLSIVNMHRIYITLITKLEPYTKVLATFEQDINIIITTRS